MSDMNGVALYRETRKTHPNLITYFNDGLRGR